MANSLLFSLFVLVDVWALLLFFLKEGGAGEFDVVVFVFFINPVGMIGSYSEFSLFSFGDNFHSSKILSFMRFKESGGPASIS